MDAREGCFSEDRVLFSGGLDFDDAFPERNKRFLSMDNYEEGSPRLCFSGRRLPRPNHTED